MEALLKEMHNCLERTNAVYNQGVDEFNEIFDQLEAANAKIAVLEGNVHKDWEIMQKQEAVIAAAIGVTQKDRSDLNTANSQLKELQRLDPKRLSKQNKGYKKTIEDLKSRLVVSEASRKKTIKTYKVQQKEPTHNAFHFDPESKNAIRILPSLHVSKTNEFDGVVGSPVIEFMHHSRGITRQGTLLTDGTVGWANAKNSTPSSSESRIAREYLYAWCKNNKVKYQEAA